MKNNPSADGLFRTERQRVITELTRNEGRVEVSDLSDRFGVTGETIRRDLADLQHRGVLKRVHGGAVAADRRGFEPLIEVRGEQYNDEKQRVAQRAAEEIADASTIIIDSGSTLLKRAEAVPTDRGLSVVTNSLITAKVLAGKSGVSVIVLGGEVQANTLAMVDGWLSSTTSSSATTTSTVSRHGTRSISSSPTPNCPMR